MTDVYQYEKQTSITSVVETYVLRGSCAHYASEEQDAVI